MSNLNEILKSATPEQIQKAGACKTADEILTFAKAEGMEIAEEQAEGMIHPSSCEILDEEMDNVAGGFLPSRPNYIVTCPLCRYENYLILNHEPIAGAPVFALCSGCGQTFTSTEHRHV